MKRIKTGRAERSSAVRTGATMLCAAICALFAGCRTVSVENNGDGKGWKVSCMSNMMKSELDGMKATISPDGTISWEMGGLSSSPSEEFAKSLMTMTYIARLAAAIASPAAASVPLSEEAADPQAVAAILAAQAAAKTSVVNAKADRSVRKIEAKAKADAAAKCATGTCTDGSCTDCQDAK